MNGPVRLLHSMSIIQRACIPSDCVRENRLCDALALWYPWRAQRSFNSVAFAYAERRRAVHEEREGERGGERERRDTRPLCSCLFMCIAVPVIVHWINMRTSTRLCTDQSISLFLCVERQLYFYFALWTIAINQAPSMSKRLTLFV